MTRQNGIATALAYVPDYLALQRDYMPFVGLQLAVRVDGELLLNYAEGVDDLEARTPLKTDHLFRIASHSKTFTAVACMQLVEQGGLRLDDLARDHVPQLAETTMGTVTLRELLAHGSGMTRDGDDATFWSLDRRFPNRDELVETIRRNGKVIEPNDRFKYSNIGYALLGLIIEAASGTSYREYVKANIVDRLNLANTDRISIRSVSTNSPRAIRAGSMDPTELRSSTSTRSPRVRQQVSIRQPPISPPTS